MASVQIKAGAERRFKVQGQKLDGTPAQLDDTTPLVLVTSGGDSAIRQSAKSPEHVIIGAPTESLGAVDITADGNTGTGVAPLSLHVDVEGTHDTATDSEQIGLEADGDEAPIGSLT